jgi:hypothetical protein
MIALEAHSLAIRPQPCKPGRRGRAALVAVRHQQCGGVSCWSVAASQQKIGYGIALRTSRSASRGSRPRNKVTQPEAFNIAPGAASGSQIQQIRDVRAPVLFFGPPPTQRLADSVIDLGCSLFEHLF